jgi:site-specific DNA-methyltransferase (cytosine-N4-specific)
MEILKYYIKKQATLSDFVQAEFVSNISNEHTFYSVVKENYPFAQAVEILDKIDWSFKDFKTQYLTHKFHPYPARFIPQIPYVFIKLFTKQGDWILDPFCGCGTTNVEALLNNRNSIGNDLNPLAVLISKVKTTLLTDEEFAILDYAIKRIMTKIKNPNYKDAESIIENLPKRNTSKYFTKDTVAKLLIIKDEIINTEDMGYTNVSNVLKVALSATVWSITESKGRTSPEVFFSKVKSMKDELKKMIKIIKFERPITKIIEGDARFLKQVDDRSIDLIITSPPYVNALDYYRIHMHNMFWLGIDFKEFKKHEIGSHSHFIDNRFRLLSEYLGDMLRAMIEMNRVLKDDKLAVIVVGNSTIEYELIESWKFFANMAETIGFKKLKVYHRPIDTTRKYTSKDIGNINDEYILVLRKISDSPVTASDDDFIASVVTKELEKFLEIVKKSPGSAVHLSKKKPTRERLMKNIVKLQEAIKNVKKDIRIKK